MMLSSSLGLPADPTPGISSIQKESFPAGSLTWFAGRNLLMKRSKFTQEQIGFALRQGDLGTPVVEVCRKMGISGATYFRWKQKYGGLGPSELRKLRQLEKENLKLKRLVADLSLDKSML